MKLFKISVLFVLLLVGFGCEPSYQTFNYHMAAVPTEDEGIAFYVPPESDTVLSNPSKGEVRNVILCIGDGMGFNHVALARHYGVGDDKKLTMERLPVQGDVTTYSANSKVTDSAAAGTALSCGVKTKNGMVGMAPDETAYSSILEVLAKKGWRTGLVVTSTMTHATPAVFASHIRSRGEQKQIAAQMLNDKVDVMFGGGKKYWDDNLLAKAVAEGYQVIGTRDEMAALRPGPALGIFADDGMTTFAPEPMLSEMASTAINLLGSKGDDWFAPKPKFFMMIEGIQIDWAAHANDTDRVVRQTLLFDMAARQAVEFAQEDGHTLVVVTADHETGGLSFTIDSDTGEVRTQWTTGNHTAANVPVFAYGPGAEKFTGTLDNTDIPKRIAELTGVMEFPRVKVNTSQEATVR